MTHDLILISTALVAETRVSYNSLFGFHVNKLQRSASKHLQLFRIYAEASGHKKTPQRRKTSKLQVQLPVTFMQ